MAKSRATPEWRRYHRAYFQRRKATLAAKTKRWTLHQRRTNFELVFDYLSGHPCIDCGEADPVVLEFDHVSPNGKRGCVSVLARGCSRKALLAEIDKCVVRCANCHRRKTAREFGYYKDVRRSPGAAGQGIRKSGADGQDRTGDLRFTKPSLNETNPNQDGGQGVLEGVSAWFDVPIE